MMKDYLFCTIEPQGWESWPWTSLGNFTIFWHHCHMRKQSAFCHQKVEHGAPSQFLDFFSQHPALFE